VSSEKASSPDLAALKERLSAKSERSFFLLGFDFAKMLLYDCFHQVMERGQLFLKQPCLLSFAE